MGKRKRCSSRLRPPDKDSCPCGYNCGYYFLRCDSCHRGCHFQCLGLKVDEARHLSVYVCPTCERSGVEAADVEAKCRAGNKPRAVVYEVLCNVHAEKASRKEASQKCYAIGYDLENSPPLKDDACCICGCVCKSQQVACDRCDLNYHCMCVGLSEKDVDGIDAFYCPKCLAANPQLRITYKDAGGAAEEGHPVEEDHAEAPDQPGPSGMQTGPANNSHASGQHAKRVRREVCVKSEQADETATSFSGVSQGTRVAAMQSNRATAFPSNRTAISQSRKGEASQSTQVTANRHNRAAASHQGSRATASPCNRAAASQSNPAVASQGSNGAVNSHQGIRASAFPSNRAEAIQNNRATDNQSGLANDSPSNRVAVSESNPAVAGQGSSSVSQSSRAVDSQSGRAAASSGSTIPGPQPAERPVDGIPTSESSMRHHLRASTTSTAIRLSEPKMEDGSGPSVPASNADDRTNGVQEPTAADLMRVLYERQVEDKQKEIDTLRNQLRLQDANLEAERATHAQVQEENARLKQENAKKDKTIVDLTMELFELKRSQ